MPHGREAACTGTSSCEAVGGQTLPEGVLGHRCANPTRRGPRSSTALRLARPRRYGRIRGQRWFSLGVLLTHPSGRFPWPVLFLAAGVCVAAASTAAQSRSVRSGVYTEGQAREGAALYVEHCAQCHGPDLAGVEQAPALAGGLFAEKWKGATLNQLFDRVESMPPAKPNPERTANAATSPIC